MVEKNFGIALYPGESSEFMADWLRRRFDVKVEIEADGTFTVSGVEDNVKEVQDWVEAPDPEDPALTPE